MDKSFNYYTLMYSRIKYERLHECGDDDTTYYIIGKDNDTKIMFKHEKKAHADKKNYKYLKNGMFNCETEFKFTIHPQICFFCESSHAHYGFDDYEGYHEYFCQLCANTILQGYKISRSPLPFSSIGDNICEKIHSYYSRISCNEDCIIFLERYSYYLNDTGFDKLKIRKFGVLKYTDKIVKKIFKDTDELNAFIIEYISRKFSNIHLIMSSCVINDIKNVIFTNLIDLVIFDLLDIHSNYI